MSVAYRLIHPDLARAPDIGAGDAPALATNHSAAGLGVVPVISGIQRSRGIWMERASPNLRRIAGNAEPKLMLGLLVMDTHPVGAQHNKHKLTGRIIHRLAPSP